MKIYILKKILKLCWSAETASGNWSPENPALNQCAVTALIVQDYFGGELLRCPMTNGGSHYWNRLVDGKEIDLTEDQFNQIESKPIKSDVVIREREYVLSFPETLKRYKILKTRIDSFLTPYP